MRSFVGLKENIINSTNVENILEKSVACCQNSNNDSSAILVGAIYMVITIVVAVFFYKRSNKQLKINEKLLRGQYARDVNEGNRRYLLMKNGLKGIISNLGLLGLRLNNIKEQIEKTNIVEQTRKNNLNLDLTLASADIQAYLRMLDRHYEYLDLHKSREPNSVSTIDHDNHQLLVSFQNLSKNPTLKNLNQVSSILVMIQTFFVFHVNKYPDIKKEIDYLLRK